jgi:hypothetical protein
MIGTAGKILKAIFAFLLFIYLALGAFVYIYPRFAMKCPPLNVNSKIVDHHDSVSAVLIAWVTWPAYVMKLEDRARKNGKSLGGVLAEDVCQ